MQMEEVAPCEIYQILFWKTTYCTTQNSDVHNIKRDHAVVLCKKSLKKFNIKNFAQQEAVNVGRKGK